MQTVQHSLSAHNIKIYGWSDSTAVLGWIQGDENRWKPFVANKVKKIKKIMPPDCWHYVKSAENPADCASRGLSASNLKEHTLWWSGPSWLPLYQQDNCEKIYTTEQELKKETQSIVASLHDENSDVIKDLLNRHSCLTRVTRILAWLLRAMSNTKQKSSYLTTSEIKKANSLIIKHVQLSTFWKKFPQFNKKDT